MAGDDLAVVGRPLESGDLRTGIHGVNASAGSGVPEVNLLVERATASREEVVLPWAPGEGLDGRLVVGLAELRGGHLTSIPNVDQVVIAAGSKLGAVRAPLQTANLGRVRKQLGGLVFSDAYVVIEDVAAARTSREGMLVPGHDSNTGVVTAHCPQPCLLLDIPDLNVTSAETDRDVGTIRGPPHRRNEGIRGSLHKLRDISSLSIPNVDIALETDGNLVSGTPIEEVQVVVVQQTGSIKDTFGGGEDTASRLGTRRLDRSVVLSAQIDRLVGLWGCRLERKDSGTQVQSNRLSNGSFVCLRLGGLPVRAVAVLLTRGLVAVVRSENIFAAVRRLVVARPTPGPSVVRLHSRRRRSSVSGRNEAVTVDSNGSLVGPCSTGLLRGLRRGLRRGRRGWGRQSSDVPVV
jgi:hypothetical protein